MAIELVLRGASCAASAARRRGSRPARAASGRHAAARPPHDGTPPDTQVGSWARSDTILSRPDGASHQMSTKRGPLRTAAPPDCGASDQECRRPDQQAAQCPPRGSRPTASCPWAEAAGEGCGSPVRARRTVPAGRLRLPAACSAGRRSRTSRHQRWLPLTGHRQPLPGPSSDACHDGRTAPLARSTDAMSRYSVTAEASGLTAADFASTRGWIILAPIPGRYPKRLPRQKASDAVPR